MRKALLVAAVCALVVGCGDDSTDGANMASPRAESPAPQRESKRAASAATGALVKLRRTRFGRILVDGNGRALYLFTRDAGRPRSRCYGECARAWPVFFTKGRPRAGRGVKQRLLGTTRRRDGRLQPTYNGHPLYYYVTDTRPGQVTCQAVPEFGGTWYVVSPRGNAIR